MGFTYTGSFVKRAGPHSGETQSFSQVSTEHVLRTGTMEHATDQRWTISWSLRIRQDDSTSNSREMSLQFKGPKWLGLRVLTKALEELDAR